MTKPLRTHGKMPERVIDYVNAVEYMAQALELAKLETDDDVVEDKIMTALELYYNTWGSS